jgi:hypothetical protein
VVKKKCELEQNATNINLNLNIEQLQRELREKKAEIARLKNKILYLKAKLEEK